MVLECNLRSTFTGPYDAIHVGAAAPTLPEALVDQLAKPGRMFIPVGDLSQDILQVDKDEEGNVTRKKLFAVSVRDSSSKLDVTVADFYCLGPVCSPDR